MDRKASFIAVVVSAITLSSFAGAPAPADASVTVTRLSVSASGVQGDQDSSAGAITPDGRYVVFSSYASTLVPDDTNGATDPYSGEDVFLRDLVAGTIERVSTASDGTEGDRSSYTSIIAPISSDGRYVLFNSGARNLTPNDVNNRQDVFVKDRATGATTLVSVGADGTQAEQGAFNGAISADGRFVAFSAFDGGLVAGDGNGQYDIFVKDLQTGAIEVVSSSSNGTPSNGQSYYPTISGDGRFAVFVSQADTLVDGDVNGHADLFLHDRATGSTIMIDKGFDGAAADGDAESGDISADGRWVAFSSSASNLVPGDTNGRADAFLYNVESGTITRITAPGGIEPNGQMTVSSISSDGRFVGLWSDATNLVEGDSNNFFDAFRVDSTTGDIVRVSVRPDGGDAVWGASSGAALSDDGSKAVFSSQSFDLVADDTAYFNDTFLAALGPVGPPPDQTPPDTVIDAAPASPTASRSATLQFHATEDGSTFECALDGAAYTACTSPQSPSGLADGYHTFSVRAIDAAGNIDETPASASWRVDGTAPQAAMSTPDGSTFAPPILPIELHGTAQDPVAPNGAHGTGLASVCFKLYAVASDGSRHPLRCFNATLQSDGTWMGRPDIERGTYEAAVHATDVVGNKGVSPRIAFKVL